MKNLKSILPATSESTCVRITNEVEVTKQKCDIISAGIISQQTRMF
jgi:hypothetical protein